MPTGTVKWFNPEKGFGFIVPDDSGDGKDIFVHRSAVMDAGFQTLAEGQKINYELHTDQERNRTSAVNLKEA